MWWLLNIQILITSTAACDIFVSLEFSCYSITSILHRIEVVNYLCFIIFVKNAFLNHLELIF